MNSKFTIIVIDQLMVEFSTIPVRPIAGGNYDPYAESTAEGQIKLAKALESDSVVLEGDREIGPWDCSGM